MSDMSYYRFQNTLRDLNDCEDALEETDLSELSEEEQRAAKRLIALCKRIAYQFDDEGN